MRTTTLLLSLCFSITTLAQNYDFGKVSREELEEKQNPLDTSANATYLYKNRKTYLQYDQTQGFQLITDIHERIKIYNQDGFDYATRKVELHKSGSDEEKLSSLKANTFNLVDGKIEDTKLDKDGIFKTELSKYNNETTFTMPNIKEGSVIEYKYNIVSPFYWNVDDFVFQHAIPVKKLEASFETPEYFNFKLNTKGYLMVTPKVETKNDKITFTSKERSGRGGFGAASISTSFSTSSLDFMKTITSYNLSDIPALKDEPYVNNIANYRSAIQYELSYTKFPQSPLKYYSTTWEDVVKTIYDSPNFGSELDKTGYFEGDIDALISTISEPMARASLIFNFVKTKVKWNNYIGKYTEVGVRKAYKDQVGNVAEINLMLTAMLRHAGLNANPILVSTRQNGIPLFPTLDGYNYVISGIEIEQGVILLDASNKYSMPNILPTTALNWEGLIIRKNKSSSTISLYPNQPSRNTVTMMANLDRSGNIEGNYRSVKTNHDAMLYRAGYLETDKNQFLESLENKYNGMEVSDYEVVNDYNLSEPITESYKFSLESQADVIGDKLYFSPMFFLKTNENPFKLEKREFPVDFGYPSEIAFRILINLPEGYKIENMPEPAAVIMPDNLAEFKYFVSGNEKSIQLIVSTKVNAPIISPMYYDSLKEYFNKFIEKEAEQIILTKI
ncbi:DUF3857 domain-containing protein [Confluentibacter flavum]|uniref:Transglutaminase n=1 Tax=Confluentibacter flavum TaxID=1909700 RepID=A0A2N3HNF0_9FLAO|nr:DUF3857 domain-containing protein [Confluentibacter flavum]PKQ46475.1 transglutaminase [Confluentibacter flavum]